MNAGAVRRTRPDLVADVVEDRRHVAQVADREDRVEHLALLAVVVACEDPIIST